MDPSGPLTLSTFGSFTVGGRRFEISGQPTQLAALSRDLPEYVVDPNGTYSAEHAYVQYYLPADQRHLPVVLVHGGGLTGACWEGTPDGRTGWLQYFLHEGRPSYVVDNVERGRAGWCPPHGAWEQQRPILRTEQDAWDTFRIGPPDRYESRCPYEGCLFPVEHLAELSRQQVPRWTTTTGLSVSAISALVRRIGRCVLIGHSQGGGIAAHVALEESSEVAALVLVEPHGLPEPEGFRHRRTMPQLIVAGDFLDLSPMYRHLQGRWAEYVDGVKDAGTSVEYFSLPEMGHPGNSHMMMMDTNSDVVAALVGQWIDAATAVE